MPDGPEHDLYGEGLLGEALAPKRTGNLAERFLVPPFTVLSAREGFWQDRKRAWIALGIKSELGRGGDGTDIQTNAVAAGTQPITLAPKPVTLIAPQAPAGVSTAPAATTPLPPPQVPVVGVARPMRLAPPRQRPQLTDPFLAYHHATLDTAGDAQLDLGTWSSHRGPIGLDIEMFRNFFVACFRNFDDSSQIAFESSERCALDRDGLAAALRQGAPIVTFNGLAYDMPIVALALSGAGNAKLKAASDRIIRGELRPWQTERELGIRMPAADHVDLMEANPSVRQGLKTIHARLHGRFIVDLPFDPEAWLSPAQMNVATLYCLNDLEATQTQWIALREPLALRYALGREHGIDLRSKSDAQIGEAIVVRRVEAAARRRIGRTTAVPIAFRYEPPAFVRFQDPALRALLVATSGEFRADETGKVTPPAGVNTVLHLGAGSYGFGIGGLHSKEEHRALYSDDYCTLIDVDVTGHYPNIIRKLGIYPPALGPAFVDVYASLVDGRAAAKRRQQEIEKEINTADGEKIAERDRWKAKADGEKVASVGVFGKLGSPYSPLYDPRLLVAVTLTGQLSLLVLIEQAEAAGVPVVSANTDGVTFHCPRNRESALDAVVAEWEDATGFSVERTRYRSLHSSSVNTYIAVKEDGSAKRKGPIADPWSDGDLRGQMSKNPQMTILSQAVLRNIRDGVPVEETIAAAIDPRQFVTVIKVNGGGVWRGTKLGRVVRFYWSSDGDPISYINAQRRVAKTDGAHPLMELTDRLPDDLDHARYIAEAHRLLADLGAGDDALL